MEKVEYKEVPGSHPEDSASPDVVSIRVYPRRWLILGLFSATCLTTTFQWVQYTIVGDLVARYYGVPQAHVEWTSLVYMVSVSVLMVPGCFLLDKMGMRWCMEMGGLLMACGACLKVVAVDSARFPLALLGQTMVGTAQVFVLGAPARVAATWFGADQLSTACAVGVFGNQVGAALGFLLPPVVVRSHEDPAAIGRDLRRMLVATAAVSTLVLVLIILLFKERPELPPSPMQARERSAPVPVTLRDFFSGVGRLLANRNYRLVLAAFGLSGGALNVVGTVLNPVVLLHFPNEQQFAGRVGLVIILSSLVGCILFGVLMDKTHKYKEISLGVYILSVLATAGFSVVFWTKNAILVYLSAGLVGLFLFGYVAVALELCAEVTHPESESTAGGLAIVPGNLLGVAMAVLFARALERWGYLPAGALVTALLALGAVFAACLRRDYRRVAANTGKA
ncbi:heme transporter FLVCR2-like [Bacillus rossius redtenbacheri]|uniref:heme transporter FLVCR2-like n=1 Tax=Bacillus rossius redtenbacheri TaxID=93214 RepID=UPI002FDD60FE